MVKRGVDTSAIGLPSKKKTKFASKTQKVVPPFSKLRTTEKDRLVSERFGKPSNL